VQFPLNILRVFLVVEEKNTELMYLMVNSTILTFLCEYGILIDKMLH
jgi:hypothetical protein